MVPLATISLLMLAWNPSEACPTECNNYCVPTNKGVDVYCLGRDLERIPSNIPTDAYRIDLRENRLTTLEGNLCALFPNLTDLYLHRNQISEIQKGFFSDCSKLTNLYIPENNLTRIYSYDFRHLYKLERLSLGRNSIQSIEAYSFVNLTKLLSINFNINKISRIEIGTFERLLALDYLGINRNNITYIESGAFKELPVLDNLDLAYNPLDCSCSILPFWTWLNKHTSVRSGAQCADGTSVRNIRSSELEICKHLTTTPAPTTSPKPGSTLQTNVETTYFTLEKDKKSDCPLQNPNFPSTPMLILIVIVVVLLTLQIGECATFLLLHSKGKLVLKLRKEKVYEDAKKETSERHVYSTTNSFTERTEHEYIEM